MTPNNSTIETANIASDDLVQRAIELVMKADERQLAKMIEILFL